jgi:hypothetical protein
VEDVLDMGTIAAAIKTIDELVDSETKEKGDDEKRLLNTEMQVDDEQQKSETLQSMIETSPTDVLIAKVQASSGTRDLGDTTKALIKSAEDKARRLFTANVTLSVIPSSEKKTRDALAASVVKDLRGSGTDNYIGVFCDQGMFGEPITAPHVRINAVNQPIIKVSRKHRRGIQ